MRIPRCLRYHYKHSCRAGRGSTTDESQMAPCCGVYAAVPVVAGRVVYTPFRSLLDACHRHAATLALSTPQSCPKVCLRSTSVGAKHVSQARSVALSVA